MLHCKTSDDRSSLPVVEQEFCETAHSLGMSLSRNAGSGIFTHPETQKAYEYWKKNRK